jgi:DNA mismatch repair protein MutS2
MVEIGMEPMDGAKALEAHAAQALEWPLLLEALAERAESAPGKERLASLVPAATIDEARQRMARVRAVLELGEIGVELPRAEFPDLAETFGRVRLGAAASGLELVQVGRVLAQARALRQIAEEHGERRPAIGALLGSDARLDRIGLRLAECLEPNGTVRDDASPALAEARARFREIASELRRRLGDLAQRYADVLSGQYYTERDGRYVLPVRSDAHYRVDGIVLGSSGSGGTLFVEPKEVTQLGNRLRVQEAHVQRETARVLEELSIELAEKLDAVLAAFDVCVEADVVRALARFAVETRSRPLEIADDDRFDVRAARHPLLALGGGEVVANDLVLAGGHALVISGPNAGGKTVALKCLGLFAWMARAGVPIPAGSESHVGWFDHVLADVGDDQSLVRSLSTFSAHVRTLAAILDEARPNVLVLLDEVAAGTDPEEGAALAAAVLETLTRRGATVAVTTHYERLKEFATAEGGALENASVGFDFRAMAPTFRLTLGVPGASSALAVASRHGLGEALITRARELLPRTTLDRERLLLELDAERERVASDRRAVEAELEQQRALTRALEREHQELHAAARERVEQETRELTQQVRALRAELLQARQRLQNKQLDRTELRAVERSVSSVASEVAVGGRFAPVLRAERPHALLDPSELVPGARVRVRANGAIGVVLGAPDRGRVQLRIGALRISHDLAELERAPANARPSAPKPARPASEKRLAEARRTSDNTLDLRGVRVEDASGRLDAFLDRMLGEGENVGFVLHGHGTGALRTKVREHLGASSYVEQVRGAEPDEGGPAFTVFWVR